MGVMARVMLLLRCRDVPLAKNPSTGTAQQRLFLVLKVVLQAVVVISEVLRLSTKSRCSRCCRHISIHWVQAPIPRAEEAGILLVVPARIFGREVRALIDCGETRNYSPLGSM